MYRNTLCRDARCNGPNGCYHRGKANSYCDFSTEEKLCEILGLVWHPGLEIDMLIATVRNKLAMLPGPEDWDSQVRIAKRNLPPHPATLTAPQEDKDPDGNS